MAGSFTGNEVVGVVKASPRVKSQDTCRATRMAESTSLRRKPGEPPRQTPVLLISTRRYRVSLWCHQGMPTRREKSLPSSSLDTSSVMVRMVFW